MILNTLFKYYACRCRGRISSPSPAQTAHCRRWDPGVAATFYSLLGNSRECERKRVRITADAPARRFAMRSYIRLRATTAFTLCACLLCSEAEIFPLSSLAEIFSSPFSSQAPGVLATPSDGPLFTRSRTPTPTRPRQPLSYILLSRPDGVSSHIGICHCMGDCVVIAGVVK